MTAANPMPVAPLVTQQQLSDLVAAVEAEGNAIPDPHALGMMVIAVFRLQHIYEQDRSRAAAHEQELRSELEYCTSECQGLAEESDMLFRRAATRLAHIKELEAKIIELQATIGKRDQLIGKLSRQLDAQGAEL